MPSLSPSGLHPSPEVVARRLGDGAVLVHLPSNRIFELNDTGMRVWELVAEGLSEAQIVGRLTDEFAVDRDRCATEVRGCLDHFRREGLLT